MENILSSNVFSKLMEQYEHDSDSVMETILNMTETEMGSSDIIKLMNDFNKTNKDVSLRNYVDEFLENEGQRFTRDCFSIKNARHKKDIEYFCNDIFWFRYRNK